MRALRWFTPPVRACAVLAVAALALTTVASVRANAAPLTATRPVRATVVATAAGTPQGPVPESAACTGTGAARTCDLWAAKGTLVLPGGSSVPIWGFSATAAGPVGLPGPVLTATVGDTVTVTVHNGLPAAAGALSLAVPGVSTGPDDTTGVPAGSTVTVRLGARRPGSFVYEAGHTAAGARQAAMGLVGALVVKPPAPAAGGDLLAYGDGTSYQDEAVLVLSEVDPALNAAPTTFDLRGFAPKYRLVNGHAYPEIPPIATDRGRKVLIRYVNAGLATHSMALLGADQTVLAHGGHPLAYSYGVVAESVTPGDTADLLAHVPADGEAKYAVYEAAGRLDNASQRVGTSQVQAFGGMLTFLDTNAPPPTGDTVGPAPSHVAVAPTPARATDTITVTADFSDAASGGSAVTGAEVLVDSLATADGTSPITFTGAFGSPTVTGATATLPKDVVAGLTQGPHRIYVRAVDAAGQWGVVSSAVLTMAVTGPATTGASVVPTPTNGGADLALSATVDDSALAGTVTGAEYFLDTPPAPDVAGTPLALTSTGKPVTEVTGTVPATVVGGLPEGTHTLYVRGLDSYGLHGPAARVTFVVDRAGPVVGTTGSVTPDPANGATGSPRDPASLSVDVAFTDPASGNATSASGEIWSTLAAAEGFLDKPDGTAGTGFVFLASDGAWDSRAEAAYGLIPRSELTALADGVHTVYVHAKDAAGNWGALVGIPFTVDRTAPAVVSRTAAVAADATTVRLLGVTTDATTRVTAAEWFAGADPGTGRGTPLALAADGQVSGDVPVSPGARGTQTWFIRARDLAGNWSAPLRIAVDVTPHVILTDTFASGNTAAWAGRTGNVTVPLVGTDRVLQTAVTATTSSFVTDTRPQGETSYHARFTFTPNTLGTGGKTVTLFRGVGPAAAGTVFDVQYRNSGNTRAFRVGTRRPTGVVYSAWTAVSGSSFTVRLDHTVGGNAGYGSTLTVNRTVMSSPAAGTGNLGNTVEAVDLGVSGVSAGVTGAARFDDFTSTRVSLP